MSLYSIGEFDEWFTRWFMLMVKNTDLLAEKEEHPEAVFSLFPKIFNYFMSSKERKEMMHRFEFVHHKGINSIKFVTVDIKKLNYIGIEEDNEEEDENDPQLYPSFITRIQSNFIISISSSQAQLLQLLSDVIHMTFEEKAADSHDITNIFRNDLCLFL
jgi:hypothetical protein